jgi:hypothetical protein
MNAENCIVKSSISSFFSQYYCSGNTEVDVVVRECGWVSVE